MEIKDIIKGIRCETCKKERKFGSPPNTDPDNLFVYTDLSGGTRCFCKKHMNAYTDSGALVDYGTKDSKVGYGAVLIEELLQELD